MNFYKFRVSWIALCFILSSFNGFAQTTADTSWFTDVTDEVGLNIKNPGGAMWIDVNNDDYPDLITLSGLGVDTGWNLYINEQNPKYPNDPTARIFVNETAKSGLNIPGVYKDLAGAADFDNDGNIDIMINCWPLDNMTNCPAIDNPAKEKCRIFWGNGDGTFTLDSIASNTPTGLEQLGNLSGSGLPALDYDRDGNLDVFVACHYDSWCTQNPEPSHLMHNNGDRTFTDKTTAAGINVSQQDPSKPWLNPPAARQLFGANMSDWNNDCWPDIFTCPYEGAGYPDLPLAAGDNGFVSNRDTQNTRGYGNLYRNNGNGTFTDVGVTANYDPHFAWAYQGMVPWAAMPADYNNDGNMDYLVLLVHGANLDTGSNYNYPTDPGNGRTCIFTNLGPDSGYKLKPDVGRIRRGFPNNQTHGDHTGCWIDMNNDGHQDLLIGDAVYAGPIDLQRIFFMLQDSATHLFNDITQDLGYTKSPSTILNYKIRRPGALDPVDFDLDGDDDIIKMPYSWPQDSVLVLRNNIGNKSNHTTIKLIAPPGVNKSCIGARIRVVSGDLKQMKDIMGDQGQWTNVFPFIQNFGLGKRTKIDTIDIRWPDANCSHTIVTNAPINKFLRIDENGISGIGPTVKTPVANNFEVYPNPDGGSSINLRFDMPLIPYIEIFNMLGQKVASYEPGYSSTFQLPLNNIPAGLYFVHVISSDNNMATKPFIRTIAQ